MNNLQDLVQRVRNKKIIENQKSARDTSERLAKSALLIPWLMFGFANLVLFFGEYRVFHYVNQLTSRPELAIGTLAATGLGAELWFIAWKYPLATKWQKWISLGMMFVNFFAATYIGFGDFFVDSNGLSYGVGFQALVGMIAIVLLFDIVFGLIYFLIDKQVERERTKAETQVDLIDQRNMAELIDQMLNNAEGVLGRMDALYLKYGEKNVEDMLALLAGESGEDKNVVSNLKKNDFRRQESPSVLQRQPSLNADVVAEELSKNSNGHRPQ